MTGCRAAITIANLACMLSCMLISLDHRDLTHERLRLFLRQDDYARHTTDAIEKLPLVDKEHRLFRRSAIALELLWSHLSRCDRSRACLVRLSDLKWHDVLAFTCVLAATLVLPRGSTTSTLPELLPSLL